MNVRTKMAQPLETFEPARRRSSLPAPAYRVLWGRIGALAGALLLAFLVGRVSAPDGVSPAEIRSLRQELSEEKERVVRLEAELASSPAPTQEAPVKSETGAQEQQQIDGQTYTVQDGDTLRGIAIKFYGDGRLSSYLAEVNKIADPAKIRVGQKLIIPPKPNG